MSCTVISENSVKTRKIHSWFACERLFPVGTEMIVQVNVFDGDIGRVYICKTCESLFKKMRDDLLDKQEGIFPEGCVHYALSVDGHKTPEEWLESLK